jgi:hypothetical protein
MGEPFWPNRGHAPKKPRTGEIRRLPFVQENIVCSCQDQHPVSLDVLLIPRNACRVPVVAD